MRVHLHWLAQRRIHRLFTQEPGSSRCRALFRELSGCDACARRYSSYQILEAALCGARGGGTPSVFAIERLRTAVFDGIEAASRPRREESHGKRVAWIAGAAFAATAAILLVVVRPWSSDQDHVALSGSAPLADIHVTARSGSPGASEIGIRLFKVQKPGDRTQARRHRVGEPGVLAIDDVITFTYTNVRPDIRYATIVGVQANGAIRWYYPGYGGKASIPLRGDKVDEPLGDGIRLQVRHTAGRLRITAIFSADPIPVESIRRAIRLRVAESREALWDLRPFVIPGTETLQHSMLTHVAPVP